MYLPEPLHRIAVVGVGCCGHNAIDYLSNDLADDVDLWVFDTAEKGMKSDERIQRISFGAEITHGLSAGAIPEVGERAAELDAEKIKAALNGYDLVFVAGGLGGGTATGAIPLFCQWLRDTGALCITIVTTPFDFEDKKKQRYAQSALQKINQFSDASIEVANQKLLTTLPKSSSLLSAFEASNQVLKRSLIGIYSLISTTGYINLDFADVRTVLQQSGPAIIGYGEGNGEHRIQQAVDAALDNPLLMDFDISQSKALLINITADASLGLDEIHTVGELLTEKIDADIPIIVGSVITEKPQENLEIYAIFSGVQPHEEEPMVKLRALWTP